MTSRPRNPHGFAMLMALAMLGLVAVVLVILAHHFAYESSRTRAVTNDAQLSQLLHAASVDAIIRSRTWIATTQPAKWDFQPPAVLTTQSAKISVELKAAGDQKAEVNIDALLDSQRAAETLRFTHTDGGWILSSAEQPSALD